MAKANPLLLIIILFMGGVMSKDISVIIPVYNAEKTIEECIMSIVAQTVFDRLELIIVDDRSSDNTVSIVSAYEARYPDEIMLICIDKNAGPGNARNIALQYASGEYIGFVDSDDAIVPDMYEKLLSVMKDTGADVVDGGMYIQKDDRAILFTSDASTGVQDDVKRSSLIVSGGYVMTKLYRREFLINEDIRFRNEYVLEDMDFLIEVFCKARYIANYKSVVYVYRDTGGSLSKTKDPVKYLHSAISALTAVYSKTSDLECYPGIQEAVEYTMIQLYSYSVNIVLKAVVDKEYDTEFAKELLEKLAVLKANTVSGNYENRYVRDKIDKADIDIMQKNDVSPAKLLEEYI